MREGQASALVQKARYLDEAELLADGLWMSLVLPRLGGGPTRPEDGPFPEIEVAVARDSASVSSASALAKGAKVAAGRVRQLDVQRGFIIAAIAERFPEATSLHAALPDEVPPEQMPGFMELYRGGDGGQARLIRAWQALSEAYSRIREPSKEGARTSDLLHPLFRWQGQVRLVRSLPPAQALNLLPPLNEGQDLAFFLAHLDREWPRLAARFASWRASAEER